MVRMQPRHKVSKALSSIPVLLVMVLISIALLVGVIQMVAKTRVTSAQAKEAKNELAMLESEHEKLVADIASLETEEGEIEALRDNYRAGTEGEKLVVIVKEDDSDGGKEKGEDGIAGFFYRLFHAENK